MVHLMEFPNALGWQGRVQRFQKMNELYGKEGTNYAVFLYEETREFEEGYEQLNTKEKKLYVTEGDLNDLMDDLQLWEFRHNKLILSKDETLLLQLIQYPKDDFIRKPKTRCIEGCFYLLTKAEYEAIPFEKNPINEKRRGFMKTKLHDSIEWSVTLEHYIQKHLKPLASTKTQSHSMHYHLIIKESVKRYVPTKENEKALEMAKKHGLNNLEFNFLNYFYESKKALRNETGQTYFDLKHKGLGWGGNRDWVKKQMKHLIDLGLVRFETHRNCRDRRYTSWYFYDANEDLNHLKHDF